MPRELWCCSTKHTCANVWRSGNRPKQRTYNFLRQVNENYRSLETLLEHIFAAPRGYLVWICRQLELPDPDIRPTPGADTIEAEADGYLEHLLERWSLPLVDVEEEKLYNPEYASNGGTHHHCIDIMLEHAVMPPVRHTFRLRELLQSQA